MKKRVVIVDDEILAIEELKFLLKDYDSLEIIGEAQTVNDAIKSINTLNPDLIFLDIQLRNATAFDILPQLNTEAHIIFATAHDEYAVRAFEINALDYLLKPINPNRLNLALNRFLQKMPALKPEIKTYTYDDKIIVAVRNGYQILNISDIIAITAEGDYSYIHTSKSSKHILIKPLKEWEQLLPPDKFIRVHRSSIINLNYISRIEKWFSNTCRIYLSGIDEPITMSQRYTSLFKKMYSH